MALTPEERLLQRQERPIFTTDSTSRAIASEEQNLANRRAQMMEAIARAREAEMLQEPQVTEDNFELSTPQEAQASGQFTGETQGAILPGNVRVTQTFGQYSPYDVFSGNRNYGVDFAVKEGTPIALPTGEWEVVEAFSGASGRGKIGNKTNRGYGNSILVRNMQTGETMRFSHLAGVNVQPGKVYKGGSVIGKSGATGNVTGPHLDLEFRNSQGKLSDILKSQYAKQVFGAMSRV